MKCEKSGNHTISYQSLLLSTTVLNDRITRMKVEAVVLKPGMRASDGKQGIKFAWPND